MAERSKFYIEQFVPTEFAGHLDARLLVERSQRLIRYRTERYNYFSRVKFDTIEFLIRPCFFFVCRLANHGKLY